MLLAATLLAVLLPAAPPVVPPATATAGTDAPAAGIPWERSLDPALAKARASHKPVMVDFWAEWCTWCHELDRSTYTDPKVVAAAREVVPVKVNTEGKRSEIRATERYGIESLPTILFLAPSGRVISRVDGFQNAERFAETLRSVHGFASDVIGWDEALTRNPHDPAALADLGAHLFDQELFEESRDLLRQAAAKDQARPVTERKRTRMLLGIIQHYDNKSSDAERLLKEALAVKPASASEDSAALFALGKIYLKSGKRAQARTALQQAIDTDPKGPVAPQAKEALAQAKTE